MFLAAQAQDRIIKEVGHFRDAVQSGQCSTTKGEPDLSWVLLYAEGRPVLFWRLLRSVQCATSRLIKACFCLVNVYNDACAVWAKFAERRPQCGLPRYGPTEQYRV
ncbi:hypothetical protein HYE68_009448 [Fusarium pseudograminearum]|nr:hypothetical protein HYE68_009448 [Fusarium pseudograminearum]